MTPKRICNAIGESACVGDGASGVKSLVLRGRTENEDISDRCCLSWRWCNNWRIQQSRANRSKCGLPFRCTHCAMDASVGILYVRETLTSLPSRIPPHTSPSQLVLLAIPFTPVVVEVPIHLTTSRPSQVQRRRFPNQPFLLASVHRLEEAFTSKPLLRSSSILCESRRY